MRWTALRRSVRARRAAEQAVTTRSSAPPSVEAALRKVRLVATVIVAIRLFSLDETRELLSWPWLIAIAGSFAAVNLVSLIGQRSGRITPVLDAVQLLADTALVLIVLWIGQDDPEPRRLGDHGPPGARRRDPVPTRRRDRELVGARHRVPRLERAQPRAGIVHRSDAAAPRRPPGRAAQRLSGEPPHGGDRRNRGKSATKPSGGAVCSARPRSAAGGAPASTSTRSSTRSARPSPRSASSTRWCSRSKARPPVPGSSPGPCGTRGGCSASRPAIRASSPRPGRATRAAR